MEDRIEAAFREGFRYGEYAGGGNARVGAEDTYWTRYSKALSAPKPEAQGDSGLVGELRARERTNPREREYGQPYKIPDELCERAADEIERLRASSDKVRAEAKREAYEEAAKVADDYIPDDYCEANCQEEIAQAIRSLKQEK